MISFTVPGQPVPKGRPRITKTGHAFTPQRTRDDQATVKWWALEAMAGEPPTAMDVRMRIKLYFRDRRRRDIDNAAKALLDGCNGAVYEDDSQVFRLEVERGYDKENPRAEVEVCCG